VWPTPRFDYVRLEEEEGDVERTREVYERAIAQVPPVQEKRFWARYMYLWVNYALFEELAAKDVDKARQVYSALLAAIPHEAFTFAKAFTLFAHFEVRQMDLSAARKIMGHGIGRCGRLGKEKAFKDYIHLERQLGEVDRCRILYGKYLEALPTNCGAWSKFADLEVTLGEEERARAVFELAIAQPALDMPEFLWKQYIDFETQLAKEGDGQAPGRVRELYERLLDRTKHVKVWVAFASYEASVELGGGGMQDARSLFRKAYDELKAQGLKDERVVLLEAWRDLEKGLPRAQQQVGEVAKLMPTKVKKRRLVQAEGEGDQAEGGWEEYYDYHFPDDEDKPMNLKILEMARMWKKTGDAGAPAAITAPAAPLAAGADADAGTDSPAAGEEGTEEDEGPSTKKQRVDEESDLEGL